MEFYEVIEKRRTIREWEDHPVEVEKLRRVLDAGVKAPSYNHMREWHFIRISDTTTRAAIMEGCEAYSKAPDKTFLDETIKRLNNHLARDVYRYSVPIQERMIMTAPELLAVCFRMTTPLIECKALFDLSNFASAWLVVENLLLAMAAEGLYGVTMPPFRTGKLKTLLGVPDDYEIATLIPFGYPKGNAKVKQLNVNLDERIHRNRW